MWLLQNYAAAIRHLNVGKISMIYRPTRTISQAKCLFQLIPWQITVFTVQHALETITGWPDEFAKRIAQNVTQPICFVPINIQLVSWKNRSKILSYFSILQKMPKKTSPNLVTLGQMLWFLKYFRRQIWRKYCRFLLKTTASFRKKYDHNIAFWEKTSLFSQKMGKNRRKLWS
jgi:hypothetical protein